MKKIITYAFLCIITYTAFSQQNNALEDLLQYYSIDNVDTIEVKKCMVEYFFSASIFTDSIWRTTSKEAYDNAGVEKYKLHIKSEDATDRFDKNYFAFSWARWDGDGQNIFDNISGNHQKYIGKFLSLEDNNHISFNYVLSYFESFGESLGAIDMLIELVDVNGHVANADPIQVVTLTNTVKEKTIDFDLNLDNMYDVSSSKWWNITTGRGGTVSNLKVPPGTDSNIISIAEGEKIPVDIDKIVEIRFRFLVDGELEYDLLLSDFRIGKESNGKCSVIDLLNYNQTTDTLVTVESSMTHVIGPNPAKDFINIYGEGAIVNSIGMKVAEGKDVIDVSFLPSGVYYVFQGDAYSKIVIER